MRFGFHISISEGFSRVVKQAEIRGCETIQLFSRNPRGWGYHPMDEGDVRAFRLGVKEKSFFPVFLHLPYLPNIGSFRSKFYKRSIEAIAKDLERGKILGAQYLIIHIGHRLESSEEEAIEAVTHGINQALEKVKNSIILLLEN
ncbi:MAG: TIM barrel protein, partial [Thermodesulfobacteriota bacterium]